MSQLSRAAFDTSYVNTLGTFADNSTRDISEGDMRQYADDISDSTVFKNDDYDYWLKVVVASGTNTYAITPTVPVAYASDEKWLIRFTNSNTGPATLNRNSLGAKDLLTNSGGALSAGDIVGGGVYIVNYNGTNYRILNVVTGTGSVSGLTSPRIPYATSATTLGDNAGLSWDNVNAFLSLGAGATPDRQLHIEKESAATATVTYLQRITSLSSGTPAAGIGVGMEFEVETAAGNNEILGKIESVAEGVTAATETSSMKLYTMHGGSQIETLTIGNAGGAASPGGYYLGVGYGASVVSRTIEPKGSAANISLKLVSKGTSYVEVTTKLLVGTGVGKNLVYNPATNLDVYSTTANLFKSDADLSNQMGYVGTGKTASVAFPGSFENIDYNFTTLGATIGVGVGVKFSTYTSTVNKEYIATIEAITTNITAATEAADLVFKTMVAGAAATEHLRFGSNKIGFFAATSVVKQAGLTAITHTSPGTPDYAIQNLSAGGFGFVTADEGNTVLSVVKAMHDALKNYGLLT